MTAKPETLSKRAAGRQKAIKAVAKMAVKQPEHRPVPVNEVREKLPSKARQVQEDMSDVVAALKAADDLNVDVKVLVPNAFGGVDEAFVLEVRPGNPEAGKPVTAMIQFTSGAQERSRAVLRADEFMWPPSRSQR